MKNNTKIPCSQISNFVWEIPKTYRSDMRVPARFFATEKMLQEIQEDRSLNQLVNVTSLLGIQKYALAMPDIHEGYGFPIGGVAATLYPDGAITPGGIGYDINCGVRLLTSDLSYKEIRPNLEKLADEIFNEVPSGVGRGGFLKLSKDELDQVLTKGVSWVAEKGYADKKDLFATESEGCLKNADPDCVSERAKKRGLNQLGSLGAGNHFLEVDRVEEIYDQKTAAAFGLKKNQVVVLIHSGSRGLGHQVASDYIKIMEQAMKKYGLSAPDHELAHAPLSSPEGTAYFNAMTAAANYAWANRQTMTYLVRRVWKFFFGNTQELRLLYDVAHNIAKIEEHDVAGKKKKLIVHRKGATRSFPGQPVIIPGSMGTASYVLVGTKNSLKESFGSTSHGSGRSMSRSAAKTKTSGRDLVDGLKQKGITVRTGSLRDLPEEGPYAYKDIDEVIEVVDKVGLSQKVARLVPLVVIKG